MNCEKPLQNKVASGDAGRCESDRHGARNRVFVWYAGAAEMTGMLY